MAAIVLIHGIANEQLSADGVEAAWITALAGGVRLAGRGDLADRILAPRAQADAIECRSAFFGDLFRTPDEQGGGSDLDGLSADEAVFARALAREWLERIAERGDESGADAARARFALDLADDSPRVEAMGVGNVVRQVLNTLAGVSWLAPVGMYVAERFVVSALRQVTRYLSEEPIRAEAQARVLALVGPETRVIVGHSLGSVVAYEAAHRLRERLGPGARLPLLVTLGAPLGLRTIVKDRLRPSPSFPPRVIHWRNAADRDDFVAAEPDLRPDFTRDIPATSRFDVVRVDNGSDPHNCGHYLGKPTVGQAISAALA